MNFNDLNAIALVLLRAKFIHGRQIEVCVPSEIVCKPFILTLTEYVVSGSVSASVCGISYIRQRAILVK